MSNSTGVVETSVVHKSRSVHATINQYEILCSLGQGMHGRVMLARNKSDGERVAIKAMRRNDPNNRRLPRSNRPGSALTAQQETEFKIRREIAVMKKCSHQNLVQLREVIDDPSSKKIFLVMEHLAGGEVLWRTKDLTSPVLTLDQIQRIMRDVTLGLEYLHHQGIIHRDIKPANLLWTGDRQSVKICDFGVSHFSLATAQDGASYDEVGLSKTAGSPAFFAPEVCDWDVNEEPINSLPIPPARYNRLGPITHKIDIWALGVTFYCLLFGTPPWQGVSEWAMYRSICTDDFVIPDTMARERIPTGGQKYRPEGRELGWVVVKLLCGLLEKDQNKRITLAEIKRIPWIHTGVRDPDRWLRETALESLTRVQVTDQDAKDAIRPAWYSDMRLKKIRDKIKNSLPKFSRRPAQENAAAGPSRTRGAPPDSSTEMNGARSSRKQSVKEGKLKLLGFGNSSPMPHTSEHRRQKTHALSDPTSHGPYSTFDATSPSSPEMTTAPFLQRRPSDPLQLRTTSTLPGSFFGSSTCESHSPTTRPITPAFSDDAPGGFRERVSAMLRQKSAKMVNKVRAEKKRARPVTAPSTVAVRMSTEALDMVAVRSSTETASSGLSSTQRAASWACGGGEDDDASSEADPTRSVVDFGAGGYVDRLLPTSYVTTGMTHSDASSTSGSTATPHSPSPGDRLHPLPPVPRLRSPLAREDQHAPWSHLRPGAAEGADEDEDEDEDDGYLSSDVFEESPRSFGRPTEATSHLDVDAEASDEDVLELRTRRPSTVLSSSRSPNPSPMR